ncbi:hypothetical protein ASD58_28310 [Duganella sp. Root1480D1]|nr:hypothetical protein ASD58_28310 [Duganella sp. Root1480D1]
MKFSFLWRVQEFSGDHVNGERLRGIGKNIRVESCELTDCLFKWTLCWANSAGFLAQIHLCGASASLSKDPASLFDGAGETPWFALVSGCLGKHFLAFLL